MASLTRLIVSAVIAVLAADAAESFTKTGSVNQLFLEPNVSEIPVSDAKTVEAIAAGATPAKSSVSIAKQREISVTGKGVVYARAETAVIHCQARAQHENPVEAKDSLDKSVIRLLTDIQALGIPKENVTHLDLNIEKRYNWKNGEQEFRHFECSQPIEISVPLNTSLDVGLGKNLILEQVVNALLLASSTNFEMNHIALKVMDPLPYITAARKAAAEDALRAAQEVAQNFGMALGTPAKLNLRDSSSSPLPPGILMRSAMASPADEMSEMSAGPVANRKISFEAVVEATFDIHAVVDSHKCQQEDESVDVRFTR
eukprot:Gregarina_sp_Pseudo_9__1814@NODE_2233_length_1084_cov_31_814354_g2056_i0_p1_GENE_NODE_2233_length_1084_cov_31_814354_g2056_i0NODE_2233_length_1084_cov_31_814354_g2056_i0_p1_ORF_typecomplete_len315_score88_38SIMPL/PF04402_14/7e27_NODE_2233_length_1084_cov_31_814354_g2056_i028972